MSIIKYYLALDIFCFTLKITQSTRRSGLPSFDCSEQTGKFFGTAVQFCNSRRINLSRRL